MKRVIVTGSHGFIGSNFIRKIAKEPDIIVYGIDIILPATGSSFFHAETLKMFPNYKFIKQDIRDIDKMNELINYIHPDEIYHFAAETHVCRSNRDANAFVTTNVLGTNILLQQVKTYCPECRFIHISTDEVYGSLGYDDDPWLETHRYDPNNPYSVTKAASNMMALSFHRNFGMDIIVTAASNTYGPNQFSEKFIPKTICHVLNYEDIPIHGSGEYMREWLFVEDHCDAVYLLGKHGKKGEIYNIGGFVELQNKDVANRVLTEISKQLPRKVYSKLQFTTDRPFNDRRYALDIEKIRNSCGWEPKTDFESGLIKTVQWYLNNQSKSWSASEIS